jgi:hypothetical protein
MHATGMRAATTITEVVGVSGVKRGVTHSWESSLLLSDSPAGDSLMRATRMRGGGVSHHVLV